MKGYPFSIKSKKGRGSGSIHQCRTLAKHIHGLIFNPQYGKEKNKKEVYTVLITSLRCTIMQTQKILLDFLLFGGGGGGRG